ncbi:MAG: hypothetical protein ABI821_12395 [Pseudomonadota bacterium]
MQGDVWDAQKDMVFAVAGAAATMLAMAVGTALRRVGRVESDSAAG